MVGRAVAVGAVSEARGRYLGHADAKGSRRATAKCIGVILITALSKTWVRGSQARAYRIAKGRHKIVFIVNVE